MGDKGGLSWVRESLASVLAPSWTAMVGRVSLDVPGGLSVLFWRLGTGGRRHGIFSTEGVLSRGWGSW